MKIVVLFSIPGLRQADLAKMPNLARLAQQGETAPITPTFPAVTCPVQANMTTGALPREHGVVANGFYYRDKDEIEMWTAWNECIGRPQLWETLEQRDPAITSAVWFPLHSKGAKSKYICTPAPIHNPDGSESLWCYTQPKEMYGELRDALGHFPLKHFWGPLANILSTKWIIESAIWAAERYKPRFWYIYLPHLDYAAQKLGPDSPLATQSLGELDALIGKAVEDFTRIYAGDEIVWIAASEYAITPVDHVTYPNRVLREAGLLAVKDSGEGEEIDRDASKAWALVDHQFAHVFVRDPATIDQVVKLFQGREGFAEALTAKDFGKYGLDHARSGEVVLVSNPNSWQAYYYWLDDAKAPKYARTVDIHRKPGYDPVELHVDMATRSIPLDATLVRGSHGAPINASDTSGNLAVIVSSAKGALASQNAGGIHDTDVHGIVMRQFGI